MTDTFSSPLGANASAFCVVAPVGHSGIAFMGDAGKFVGTGKQRIESLRDEPGRLTVGVVLATNETSVVLHGYAADEPKAKAQGGTVQEIKCDSTTKHFMITINTGWHVDKSSADPTRKMTVILETPTK